MRLHSSPLLPCLVALALLLGPRVALAQSEASKPAESADVKKLVEAAAAAAAAAADAKVKADTAWMLASSALVMLMVPGLALFYAGMVRRKNVLATMMHSMVALAIVGVYWVTVGYSLAFGESVGGLGIIGWSDKLLFLAGVKADELLPGTNLPVYVHVMFQGMFAIITPALISGALAERIRFLPYCIFLILWVTLVYCPLAHMVWAYDWFYATPLDATKGPGMSAIGYLGKMGALDFAGGTVVHIAAGFSALAAILVLRKRLGYPEHAIHPNSMVLTLTGAGLLWFGWFGFNGGSAVASGTLAASAFAATQAAAAAAGLSWMLAEWMHKGKPTALGLASGIVAGLVAVTPASGYVPMWGGLAIGLIAGVFCYGSVCLKGVLKYDDSLDAFGVHGVGGFLGAILTGVFCSQAINVAVPSNGILMGGGASQLVVQFIAAGLSAVLAFALSLVLVGGLNAVLGFTTDAKSETDGLDRTEHGETGFDFGPGMEMVSVAAAEPRPASVPPDRQNRFSVVLDGVNNGDLLHAWSGLCQPGATPPSGEFLAVYPHVTTVQGNRFRCRGGEPEKVRINLERLFQDKLKGPIRARVETN